MVPIALPPNGGGSDPISVPRLRSSCPVVFFATWSETRRFPKLSFKEKTARSLSLILDHKFPNILEGTA